MSREIDSPTTGRALLGLERAARERLARLQRISVALATAITTEDLGRSALEVIASEIGASVGSLTVLSADARTIELVGTVGMDPERLAKFRSVPIGTNIAAADAVRTGEPQYIESPADHMRMTPALAKDSPFPGGTRIAIPIRVRDRVAASMNFGFDDWRPIREEERELQASIATLVGQALERVQLYEKAERRRRETELLFELSAAANRAHVLEEVFEPALEAVCAALDVNRASILVADEKRIMRFRAWRGLSDTYRAAVDGHSPWRPDDPAARPIFVDDVSADPAYAAYLPIFEAEKIAALAFVPLVHQGRLLGKFMVYAREPRRFSEHDDHLAQAIASQVSQAIVRAELLAAERRQRAHAESLADTASRLQGVTAALSKASSVADVASVTVRDAAVAARAATAGLWVLDAATASMLELVASHGYGETAQAFQRIPLASPMRLPVVDAVAKGEPVFLESRAAFASAFPEADRVAAQRAELAIAALPMVVDGRVLGVLAFTFDEVRTFTAEERGPLEVLARYCAQAFGRARLFEREAAARAEAEAAQRRTGFLLEASALLSSSLDFQETLQRLARLAVPRMADWCGVELALEPGAPSQELAVAHVDPHKVALARELRRRWPADPASPRGAANVIRTGRSELYAAIDDELLRASARSEEHLAVLRELGIRSAMVVPMSARGRTFGALTFIAAESGRYGPQDVELAELLGRRAGIAIDNALLYEAAQAAVRAREKVLAVVSHDLLNPLSVVLMGASTLERDVVASNAARVTRTGGSILRAGQQMQRLIKDLLDFTGMQTGRVKIQRQPCDAKAVVAACIEMLAPLAREREVRLDSRLEPSLPPVEWDRDRVIQALGNLVSNAVKVTASGGSVVVAATLGDGEVLLAVEDTGPGIRDEDLPRIFEAFWRSEQAPYKGTGLGLAIAKEIADAHGGRLAVSSVFGEGSRFTLALPVTRA